MNKKTLIEELSRKTNLTIKDCKNAVNEFQNIIIDALKRGDTITLMNFGSFKVVERKERTIYNPIKKEYDRHNGKRVPIFKSSSKLKNMLS